jgi:RNA recognition motif-containing protein
MQTKLFVRNLSFNTQESDLSGLFSSFGDVVSARLATDRDTGRSRGFGFVEMKNDQAAQDAIHGLDNSQFGGRTIQVQISEARDRKPQMAYAGRGY